MPGFRGMPAVMTTMSEFAVSLYSLVPLTYESRFSIGMASSKSRPLPWGTPSTMSINTTSASSLEAIQWAAVAPTFPEPTIVTFFRMNESSLESLSALGCQPSAKSKSSIKTRCKVVPFAGLHQYSRSHVVDDMAGKLASLDLPGAFHQALEVVGHQFLVDRAFHAALDQVGCFVPAQEPKHHHARQNHRSRI